MVVAAILGVVKTVPVPTKLPKVGASYQFNVPAFAVALKVTLPASQRLFGPVDVILGVTLTVAVTAVLAELHVPEVVST